MEKILVTLLVLFFFGIALRFLHAGHVNPIKPAVAFLVGLAILIAASRKAPMK